MGPGGVKRRGPVLKTGGQQAILGVQVLVLVQGLYMYFPTK
jgi:hypothetical protein